MFTFIHYPCMGPTYNESERMLHMVVMRRKICQKLITGEKDHVRHHNGMSIHVGQDGAELAQKTVRSALDDLICYDAHIATSKFLYLISTLNDLCFYISYTNGVVDGSSDYRPWTHTEKLSKHAFFYE